MATNRPRRGQSPLAQQLGAHLCLDSNAQDVAAKLTKLGGAKVILATVTSGRAMGAAIPGLSVRGKLVVVGVGMDPIEVSPLDLISGSRSVVGHASGASIDSQDTMAFSALTGVRPMIETIPFERAAEACDKMMRNEARFRMVLVTGQWGAGTAGEASDLLIPAPYRASDTRYDAPRERGRAAADPPAELGVGCIAFSPLAQGMLTDKYLHGVPADARAARQGSLDPKMLTEENLARVRALGEIARQRGQSLAQMALAWTLRDPRVTAALIGARNLHQLDDSLDALHNLSFSPDELTRIDQHASEGGVDLWRASSTARAA